MSSPSAWMTFPPLRRLDWLVHGFAARQEGIPVQDSKEAALLSLRDRHATILRSAGVAWNQMRWAEQVHGNRVATVGSQPAAEAIPQADGLATDRPEAPLGIYVADCCAVYLVETRRRAIALLHSGRKGTAAHIVHEGIDRLKEEYGAETPHMTAVLSPCIHSCCYEVDFIGEIERQLHREGVGEVWRHPDCTGCRTDAYYSYRREKGKTGRMLAVMMITGAKRKTEVA